MSDRRKRRPLPAAVLLSGTGRTLKNINDRVAAGRLDVEVRLVIASTPKATGVRFAGGAPSRVIERRGFSSDEAFSNEVFAAAAAAELVAGAGPLPVILTTPQPVKHPSGADPRVLRRATGHHVHQSATDYGVAGGCMVHLSTTSTTMAR